MIWIVIFCVLTLSATAAFWLDIWFDSDMVERVVFLPISVALAVFVGFTLALLAAKVTTGALPDYSSGVREGYIVRVSTDGLFFKTVEGELQSGTGEQSAIQECWEFSVVDPLVVEKLKKNLGGHVRLSYSRWFVLPIKYGVSNNVITGVTLLEGR